MERLVHSSINTAIYMNGVRKLNYALKTRHNCTMVNVEPAESHGFQTTANNFVINAQIRLEFTQHTCERFMNKTHQFYL